MAGVLDTVDQRTRLVGENRLEILLFRLAGQQLFALNVFKIREVMQLPRLTQIPQRAPHVVGVIHLRGQTIPVIDLSGAIGMRPQAVTPESTIIITEYNRSVQGFRQRRPHHEPELGCRAAAAARRGSLPLSHCHYPSG